jgi:hypothetical protein
MKRIFLLSSTLLLSLCAFSQEMNLAEILDRYFKAVGMANLQKSNTMILTGSIVQQDLMPVQVTRMRPDKYRMDFSVVDMPAIQAYDGKTAWLTAPWTNNPRPQAAPADRAKDIRIRADFDGVLFNWQAKGNKAELEGKDTVENRPAYRIKYTQPEGVTEYYFIDAGNYLLVKRIYFRKIRDQEVPVENYYTDYRDAGGGVMVPFSVELRMNGQSLNTTEYESVVLGVSVDPAIFTMPLK